MPKVILICGKIGCGKTTYAKKLCRESGTVLLSVDEIMLALFGQHAGEMHDEYARRTQEYLFQKSLELLDAGLDVILDWGFWTKSGREQAKAFYRTHGRDCRLVYLDVPDEIWKERLESRNRAVESGAESAYYVDENLAAKFAARFQPPEPGEIDLRIEK